MKTLIAYCTTHGCTEKIAHKMKESLGGETDLVNLKTNPDPDLNNYGRVIIGGSIHAGQIQKKVKEFSLKNKELLINKELGLFICCMEEGEKAHNQLLEAFPEELLHHAKASAYLGGEFDFAKMNYFQKMIVKKVANIKASTSRVNNEEILDFSKKMSRIFNPFLFLI